MCGFLFLEVMSAIYVVQSVPRVFIVRSCFFFGSGGRKMTNGVLRFRSSG